MKDNNMSKVEMMDAILMIINKQNKLLNNIDYEDLIDVDIEKLYRIFNHLDKKVDQIFEFYKDCPVYKKIINKNQLFEKKELSNFIFEWQEVTPYSVLGIKEKEYTKTLLLKIIRKKIMFIQNNEINKEQMKKEIDKILDAYNKLIKTSSKKR